MKKNIFLAALMMASSAFAQTDVITVTGADKANEDGLFEASVNMANESEVNSYQFDIVCPEGIEVAYDEEEEEYMVYLSTERTTAKKHNTFETGATKEGGLRVLCGSTKNSLFAGNEGEICTIAFKATTPGEVTLKGIVLGTSTGKASKPADVTFNVGGGTGIDAITVKQANGAIYNLAGQRVNKAQKGIFIQNGVKILK